MNQYYPLNHKLVFQKVDNYRYLYERVSSNFCNLLLKIKQLDCKVQLNSFIK